MKDVILAYDEPLTERLRAQMCKRYKAPCIPAEHGYGCECAALADAIAELERRAVSGTGDSVTVTATIPRKPTSEEAEAINELIDKGVIHIKGEGNPMFHWRNEVYFGRQMNGAVRILQRTTPPAAHQLFPDADMSHEGLGEDGIGFDISIPVSEWESIVKVVGDARPVAGKEFPPTGEASDLDASTRKAPLVAGDSETTGGSHG